MAEAIGRKRISPGSDLNETYKSGRAIFELKIYRSYKDVAGVIGYYCAAES